MALLKFRIYFEEDDSIYRDIAIHHKQDFTAFHTSILTAFEFDNKHQATFYRSNDTWQRGKEITLDKYDKEYVAEPLLMKDTAIGTQIFTTTQKFIYQYDFAKNWIFLIELISVSKEEVNPANYPLVVRKEGLPPSQYGTKGLMGTNKITEVEEKYDLNALLEGGFGTEGEEGIGDELSGAVSEEPSAEE
jgi:Plasmid pRiA4b ORF-3-like protein